MDYMRSSEIETLVTGTLEEYCDPDNIPSTESWERARRGWSKLGQEARDRIQRSLRDEYLEILVEEAIRMIDGSDGAVLPTSTARGMRSLKRESTQDVKDDTGGEAEWKSEVDSRPSSEEQGRNA